MSTYRSLAEIAAEQQKQRPGYLADPAGDRALALLIEVVEELCVLNDRMDTLRRLAAAGKPLTDEAIDSFEVDEALAAERLARHRALFEKTFARLVSD
jgi:hypothetical protein